MNIKLFEKKYRKTIYHDGTVEIDQDWLQTERTQKAYQESESYIKGEFGKVIETITTKTLDLASIKKEFPQCVKVKIGDLYIKL